MAAAFVCRCSNAAVIQSRLVEPGKQAQVIFTKQFRKPCTLYSETPITTPGRHAFEVTMPVKEGMTAFGYSPSDQNSAYMMTDLRTDTEYISFGGAGVVYPAERSTGVRYGAGDTVRMELEIPDPNKPGIVRFSVNGRLAAEVPWTHGLPAWPAISCRAGLVQCDVSFD